MDNKINKKKKRSKKKIVFIAVALFFLIIAGIGAGAYFYVNDKIQSETDITDIFEDPEQQKEAELDEEKGLINILLVGVDARPGEKIGRTDSIILATIDTNNKRVKLTSFMRDMYVEIPGYKNNKINAAFAIGGPELLIKTINHNFNLNVQYFASINFNGFQEVVDELGGINVEVKDYEVDEINKAIKEVNKANSTYISGPGYQPLNGQQALAYSRIRKVGNSDYERTERQRTVLSALIANAKKVSLLKLPNLVTTMLPHIKTNVPTPKILSLANTVYKFGNTPTDTLRIPGNRMFDSMRISGVGDSLVPDLGKNISLLEQFIYSSAGAAAGDIPIYLVNNYHANDISLDKRGKSKPPIKIVVPEPDPEEPETPVEGEEDVMAPSAPVIIVEKGEKSAKVTIGGSIDDVGVKGYEYSFDKKVWKTYTKTLEINESTTIYARALDEAENISQVSEKEIKFEKEPPVDNNPPEDKEAPKNAKVTYKQNDNEVVFTISGSRDSSEPITYKYKLGNGEWINCTESFAISVNDILKHKTISVIAIDNVGNRTNPIVLTAEGMGIKEPVTPEPPGDTEPDPAP